MNVSNTFLQQTIFRAPNRDSPLESLQSPLTKKNRKHRLRAINITTNDNKQFT